MENNKLIAEFMGVEKENGRYYFTTPMEDYKTEELYFDVSWDWLMPVVEKINLQVTLGHATGSIHKVIDKIHHRVKHTMIDATYQAVVEFIKQYNEK